MKLARHWAIGDALAIKPDGQSQRITCWRWSEDSQEDAQHRADAAAHDAARRVEAGSALGSSYGYSERPPREEIVKEIKDDGGQTTASITRNSYGSLILNTRDLMFIDIDLTQEPPAGTLIRGIKRLFGSFEDDPATVLRERIATTATAFSDYTIRLYETAAGYRCEVVNRPVLPATQESDHLLSSFDADPLYVRLCHSQQCYRVRLTPKYWRCNAVRPPSRYPWEDQQQKQEYRQWQMQYEKQCQAYASCRLLKQFGHHPTAPQLELLINLHDHMTRVAVDPESVEGLA